MMPSLPPHFNGSISGTLTLSVSNISLHKKDARNIYVQFQWSGSSDYNKLVLSKYSKVTYDIRASFRFLLDYLTICTLKCIIRNYENKIIAQASIHSLSVLVKNNHTVKSVPLVNNNKIVGNIELYFILQNFHDTTFDNDITYLKTFGIQNKAFNVFCNREIKNSNTLNCKNSIKSVSSMSSKSDKSIDELTSDYLMGKDMAPEEEEEALSNLRSMPSAESIISAAEKVGIYSPPLHDQGESKMKSNVITIEPNIGISKTEPKNCKPNFYNLKTTHKSNLVNIPKDDVYLHLSVMSLNIYHTSRSLQNYVNTTYFIQCLKDQEPCKSLRFMSKQMENNVVKFKKNILSSRLEVLSAKGITLKAFVRVLSERSPITLGETKSMLDWTDLVTEFGGPRYIKVPIWHNNKITGHVSLSYEFSKTPIVQECQERFTEKMYVQKPQPILNEFGSIENHVLKSHGNNDKEKSIAYNESFTNNQYLYSRLYPEYDTGIARVQPLLKSCSREEFIKSNNDKQVQATEKIRQLNKSVQTNVKLSNVAVQVDMEEFENSFDRNVSCDVQNIFRCTHELTLYIEKKIDSPFHYVTYQFPESVTDNTGKIVPHNRTFRTFGNTNILHLITLPTTISLETYFHNNCNKTAIIMALHQNSKHSIGKATLLISHIIDMANEYESSHITKNFVLFPNYIMHDFCQSDVHIKIHYKRVYHSLPSPKTPLSKTSSPKKSAKKNSLIFVDLTESDSEDLPINKTFTLGKQGKKYLTLPIDNSTQTTSAKFTQSSCSTQTDKIDTQSIIIKSDSDGGASVEYGIQTDTFASNNKADSIEVRRENDIYNKFDDSDIFKAKMTIVCGYNLPMVKLNGESTFTAPTTYVLMESYGGNTLTTPSVVQKINPIWNSEWTILLPKHLLIEEKWLILELWCKKFQNEYAGHDSKRDMRLGFIFLDLSSLKYNLKHAGGLYDVISETEEYHGKIKVIIDTLSCSNIEKQSSLTSNNKQNIIDPNKLSVNSNSEIIFRGRKLNNKTNDLAKLKSFKSSITSNQPSKVKYCDHVDLTKPGDDDTTEMLSGISLKKHAFEYKKKCDSSSITSWTSSSDDIILCSKNPQFQLMNAYLNNEVKLNQIK